MRKVSLMNYFVLQTFDVYFKCIFLFQIYFIELREIFPFKLKISNNPNKHAKIEKLKLLIEILTFKCKIKIIEEKYYLLV